MQDRQFRSLFLRSTSTDRKKTSILPRQLLGIFLLVQLTHSIDVDELVENVEGNHDSLGKSTSSFDLKFFDSGLSWIIDSLEQVGAEDSGSSPLGFNPASTPLDIRFFRP